MFAQPQFAPQPASRLCSRRVPVSALSILCAVGLMLLLLTHQVYAAQVSLAWDAPISANVGGYKLYYWQSPGQTPASVDVGPQTSFTLTGLKAGQTYNFAATAYDVAKTQESVYSNVVSQTFPADAPVAHFSATPSTGTVPLNVTFTSTSTGTITSWAWTFGDGGTSTVSNPSHTYTAVGTYKVQLIVTGPSGKDTVTATVTVSPSIAGSLVAAYSFNESSGTTVTDVSGQGNDGTLNGATWTTAGKFGGALAFNGTSAVVTIPDAPSLDFTTSMTLEAWVNPVTAMTDFRALIVKNYTYYLYASVSGYCGNGTPLGGINVTGAQVCNAVALPATTWTHLAVTYNGATMVFYKNGVQVASTPAQGTIPQSTQPLQIGASQFGEYFQGRIDEVRLYNRALSAPEIQSDMQTPINVLNSLPPL